MYCPPRCLFILHPLKLNFGYKMLCLGFIFVSCVGSLISFSRYVYYWPVSLRHQTTSDFAAISIFSSYVPLCNTSLIFLYLYRPSHAYVSFFLVSCMTPLHCYAHAPLSFEAIDSNSFATYSLPCCASVAAALARPRLKP